MPDGRATGDVSSLTNTERAFIYDGMNFRLTLTLGDKSLRFSRLQILDSCDSTFSLKNNDYVDANRPLVGVTVRLLCYTQTMLSPDRYYPTRPHRRVVVHSA